MTEHTNLVVTPRDRFLKAAQQELIAFEQKEREFRERDRRERAEKLQLPADVTTKPSFKMAVNLTR
jgi:hypothetical protein